MGPWFESRSWSQIGKACSDAGFFFALDFFGVIKARSATSVTASLILRLHENRCSGFNQGALGKTRVGVN
ncbi:hypothetical protein D8M30_11070 [Corynebacterium pseudodiphtheriticum]|nr:hypothetical protein D8M30_11070 [Corynebacterium pseudodiphtheriticum]